MAGVESTASGGAQVKRGDNYLCKETRDLVFRAYVLSRGREMQEEGVAPVALIAMA